MRIVVDASAILCVLLNQGPKESVVARTAGATLVAPGSLPWEIGNALSSLMKRRKITEKEAAEAIDDYMKIPIQIEDIDLKMVMSLVKKHLIYAYDGYMILCARNFKIPLLTLDAGMIAVAQKENVRILEV
jgi:predicted nucleic acid-binding protein